MFLLRDLEANDYQELYESGIDAEAKKYYDPKVFESLDSLKDYFSNYFLKLKEQTGMSAQIIELNNKVIGFIYFCYVNEKESKRVSELAYVLHKDYRKRGIMTKACKELITRGFKELNLDIIQISCYPDNIGSVKLAHKLGMKLKTSWFSDDDKDRLKPINLYAIQKNDL